MTMPVAAHNNHPLSKSNVATFAHGGCSILSGLDKGNKHCLKRRVMPAVDVDFYIPPTLLFDFLTVFILTFCQLFIS